MKLTKTGKADKLFDGKVNVLHTGADFGIVHPKDPNFPEQFKRLQKLTGQRKILAQRLAGYTKVTPITSIDELEVQEVDGFLRTHETSDGVIVSTVGDTRLKIAVMIMNADCGVIKIFAPNGELAVLHGGLDCVDNPKDGSSIVRNAIDYFRKQIGSNIPKELLLSVGEAALSCCYGSKTSKPSGQNTSVLNMPRKGNMSFNIPEIIKKQAIDAGLQTANISIDKLCTSCHGLKVDEMNQMDVHGTWFSNLREKEETVKANGYGSRNAVVVWA